MSDWTPTKAAKFIILSLKEVGKPYVLGSEGEPGEVLATWDCSELVQHMLAMTGITSGGVPVSQFDGAGFQWAHTDHISLDMAIGLPGALLFIQSSTLYPTKPYHIGHVAISLGNGYIIEARGKAYGVVIGPVRKSFTLAGKVADLYSPLMP